MIRHPQISSLNVIYQAETKPFRKVHRMIDLFETIIKTHTAVMMGEYFRHNQISDTAKGMLAADLRTPSLGIWQLVSSELYKGLKESGHVFMCSDFATAFEVLDNALNQPEENVISFRNGYAHGATPADKQCENDIKQFEPFLNKLMSLNWLHESNVEAIDGKVHLRNETNTLNLHPIIVYRAEESEQPFVFLNDLKNDMVGMLNYPLSKNYRDKILFSEFNQYQPIQDWKKSRSNIFNQRIEELTETFVGRLAERTAIKIFVTSSQKGYLSIQGNPGIGKSALIAQVYKDLTNSDEKLPIQLVEYFIRRGTPQSQVSFLINHLLKKTDELFPSGKEIKAEGQTTWELQQQLYSKWNAFGESDSPFKIIFLIDGLDEGVENDILKYLPRENFKNILFIYGSRPGGNQQLGKFWGELPVEHHQKIELCGLSKEDIRALLYEVANKYEIDKDSKWIDYLQQRSQGNPLYLRLLCNAIEEGRIAINDFEALPEAIDDYYKSILLRYSLMPDSEHLLNSLFVFAAALDYLTPMHLSEILGFGTATQSNVMSTLLEVLYENPMTENVLDYQLFHESLREYLKKYRASEVTKAEQKIIHFCGRWKTLEGNYEQQYPLRYYAPHLSTQDNTSYHHLLITLTEDAGFIVAQKKVLRNFEATHQLYQYGIEIATQNKWIEAAIDCGLGIVNLKYEEQNDVTTILEMVKHNEMDLALQRITALRGTSAADKQRQFIVIMLCTMELTLLESKTQPWRKIAIAKLLVLMDESIPVDYSILKWNDFFPANLMFLIAVELKVLELDYSEIFKRTYDWDIGWIKNKGTYSDVELDVLIRTAEGIKTDRDKSLAFLKIAVVLENQGKLAESNIILEKSIQTVEDIWHDLDKSSPFKEIAVVLANRGEIEKSIQTAEGIISDKDKSSAFKVIAVVLANRGEIVRSIQTVEGINNDSRKISAYLEIAVVLANQGKLIESSNILEKSIQTAEGIKTDWDKISAYLEIAVVLANQGNLTESGNILEKSIQTAEGLTNANKKSSAFTEIAVVLANQGKSKESSMLFDKSIRTAEGINNDYGKSEAFKEIAILLANQGEIDKSLHTAEGIKTYWDKISAYLEIAVVLANQGNLTESSNILEKSIQTVNGINYDKHRISGFKKIAVVLANQGKLAESSNILEKLIQTAEGINDDFEQSSAVKEIAIVLANMGEIEKSIQTADGIKNDKDKSSAFKEIAVVLANQGKIEESMHIAEEIHNDFYKSYAFKEIAVVLANQGKLAESTNIFEKSIQTAEGIKDDFYKSYAFKEIAIVLANKGDIEKSIQTIEGINDYFDKSSAFKEIALVLANQGEIEKSIQKAEGIKKDFQKSYVFKEIAVLLANQGKLAESSYILEKSIQTAEGINDDFDKSYAFKEIAVALANQGEIDKSLHTAEGIITDWEKSSAFMQIAVVLANQGEIDKSIQMAEGIKLDWEKSSAFKEIAVVLANQGKLLESIYVVQKINSGYQRIQAWVEIGKDFYKKNKLQNLHQTLAQLPNDEAITLFKKGIAQSITTTNANEETILQILPLVKSDKESVEHIMQMHALYCIFFENISRDKLSKLNRTLNIQWALDIASKFEKE